MAQLPERTHSTLRLLEETIKAKEQKRRSTRLGPSVAGNPCSRRSWLSFRWAAQEDFDAQKLQIFERGHKIEAEVIELLKAAGLQVWDLQADGSQYTFTAAEGHAVVKIDGVVKGLPESSKPHLLEVKGLNQKGFDRVSKMGCQAGKPEHYHQCQIGMGRAQPPLERALYIVKNKNTEEFYIERIRFDPQYFLQEEARVAALIQLPEPPEPIQPAKSGFPCDWCNFKPFCHGKRGLPKDANCRTCLHSTPVANGEWHCAQRSKKLSLEEQEKGCDWHLYIPSLIPGEAIEVSEDGSCITYQDEEGNKLYNHAGGEVSDVPF